jgi:dihydrofolate reductase
MKVILIAAVTVNGKIAHNDKEFVSWTSQDDKQYFMEISKNAGVVIMGRKTYETLEAPLPDRLNVVLTNDGDSIESNENLMKYSGDFNELLVELEEKGYNECILAGGKSIYTQFLNSGLVDEMHITVVPIIFGNGVDFLDMIEEDIELEITDRDTLGDKEVLIKYKVQNPAELSR